MPDTDTKLLNGRYLLRRKLYSDEYQGCEVWDAEANPGQNDEYRCLIRTWSFEGDKPPALLLTLWTRELRHQLRLASLADADEMLVVLRDAGVDEHARCFVTIHIASGQNPIPLKRLLERRTRLAWLTGWKDPAVRARLWRGLLRIAEGLSLLHSQQMLHRTLDISSVFADGDEGPETFRLGGFEWTVRLGDRNVLPLRPPELSTADYSHAADWFLFGVLCTRLLVGEPSNPGLPALVGRLRAEAGLSDRERDILERLLDPDPQRRISRVEQVRREILTVLEYLEQPRQQRNAEYLALVVNVSPQSKLARKIDDLQEQNALEQRIACRREQLALDRNAPDTPAVADDVPTPRDARSRLEWIESDLAGASLVRHVGTTACTLRGRQLLYKVTEHVPPGAEKPPGTWELAFTESTWDIRAAGYQDDLEIGLPVPVRVFQPRNLQDSRALVVERTHSWKPFVARKLASVTRAETEQNFVDFLRLTNQIEALMHDASIFGYQILDQDIKEGIQCLVVEEKPRDEKPLPWALRVKRKGVSSLHAMIDEMRNEEARMSAGTLQPPRLQLTSSDHLRLHELAREPEAWDVLYEEEAARSFPVLFKRQSKPGCLYLRRSSLVGPPPPPEGFLRPWEHWRQTLLVARRQTAIEALPQHAYLLRALLNPKLMRIDTGLTGLPLDIDQGVPESQRLDDAKKKALQNIWRTRPIFTLQGPPGTGKTTLVTALLRQIFAEDRNAQVLVTAQAHAAVDTLRERVERTYEDTEEGQRPLAIRLKVKGTSERDDKPDKDYPDQVADRLLTYAATKLPGATQRSSIQERWLEVVLQLLQNLKSSSRTDPNTGAFLELLRRAANLTYCTSTAGDLSVLSTRTQSFDWCIVEEAAKAHGHDLVLPLQLGYRWLLIGDHYQLKPHRYRDFQNALADLPAAMQRLKYLMNEGNRLVDRELVQRWFSEPGDQHKLSLAQEKLQRTCQEWLRFFEHLFKDCGTISADEVVGSATPIAQMLDQQHRMHPVIAQVVSRTFYESQTPAREICSMTGDSENPASRVCHAFVKPPGIADKSIVWIDVPWRKSVQPGYGRSDEGMWSSRDEAAAVERFLRSLEIDPAREQSLYAREENIAGLRRLKLAVLSPYRKQVFSKYLRSGVERFYASAPSWLREEREAVKRMPRTVDSYQGNEAALVVVSLVRNNREKDPGDALGFLGELDRINVMFSRAERLLVLVGSWDFFASVASRLKEERRIPEWSLLIDHLTTAFSTGKAIKFHVNELPPIEHWGAP